LKAGIVIASGYVVLAGACAVVLSTAFLRGGHPPGSAYVNLLVFAVAYPVSLAGAVIGLASGRGVPTGQARSFHVMTGVCLCFGIVVTLALVLKSVFGKTI
jgi:hypothetical protein